jgi:hypothetical protein
VDKARVGDTAQEVDEPFSPIRMGPPIFPRMGAGIHRPPTF